MKLLLLFSLFIQTPETYVLPELKDTLQTGPSNKVNPWKYALISAVVPGLGDFLSGHTERAKIFFLSEGLLWVSYLGVSKWISSIVQSYRVYAGRFAGANPNDSRRDYWTNVENYENRSDYLEFLRREARALYPNDRNMQDRYVQENDIGGYWEWESPSNWIHFQGIKAKERKLEQRKRILTFSIILNHLVSTIETFFTVKVKTKNIGMEIQPDLKSYGAKIKVEYRF